MFFWVSRESRVRVLEMFTGEKKMFFGVFVVSCLYKRRVKWVMAGVILW